MRRQHTLKDIDTEMVERAKLDPTIDEIVVALRETTRGAGRAPQFTLVGRRPEGNRSLGAAPDDGKGAVGRGIGLHAGFQSRSGSTDIGDLRDGEIERLLADNARLHERVMFLLKVIEREQACNAEFAAERSAMETDRGAVIREVRSALETELRPVLLVVLGLLKKQRAEPAAEEGARRPGPETAALAASVAALSNRIVDLGHGEQGSAQKKADAKVVAMPLQLKLRQRAAWVINALRG